MRRTDTAAFAHVRLPALAWGEKDGTVTNSERGISRQRAFLPAPGEARADWWIVAQVAARLGFGERLRLARRRPRSSANMPRVTGLGTAGSRAFDIGRAGRLDDADYDGAGAGAVAGERGEARRQRPLLRRRAASTPGRARAPGRFEANGPAEHAADSLPLTLNTGRVRDQWHTMTRTGKSPRLGRTSPSPMWR